MILVLNFGSQLTHMIARRLRELGAYSEIMLPYEVSDAEIDDCDAIVLSGGPGNVYNEDVNYNPYIFKSGKPLLGLCYGHQLIAQLCQKE